MIDEVARAECGDSGGLGLCGKLGTLPGDSVLHCQYSRDGSRCRSIAVNRNQKRFSSKINIIYLYLTVHRLFRETTTTKDRQGSDQSNRSTIALSSSRPARILAARAR